MLTATICTYAQSASTASSAVYLCAALAARHVRSVLNGFQYRGLGVRKAERFNTEVRVMFATAPHFRSGSVTYAATIPLHACLFAKKQQSDADLFFPDDAQAQSTETPERRSMVLRPNAVGAFSAVPQMCWVSLALAQLIEHECEVKYDPSQAWRILRKMGWSCQRPTGCALELNEEKIQWWKRER